MPRSFVANGDIRPSRAVKLDTTAEGRVLEGNADDKLYGIAHESLRRHDSTLAAQAGENITVYTEGDECHFEAGGTIAVDDRLECDNDGKATATTTDNNWIIAIARTAGVSGQLIRVQVVEPTRY